MYKRIASAFSLVLLCTQLTGCFLDCPDGTHYSCTQYGSVTECRPGYGGTTRCETRQECVSYDCVGDNRPPPYHPPGRPTPPPHGPGRPGGPRPPRGFVVLNENTANEVKKNFSTLEPVDAMGMIANGDIEGAYNLGLESKDLMRILTGAKLEAERQEAIAKLNEMSVDAVTAKVTAIRERLESERKDISSAYWQTCMASGKWRTDANTWCEKLWWPGCSPTDRASYCVSDVGAQRLKL